MIHCGKLFRFGSRQRKCTIAAGHAGVCMVELSDGTVARSDGTQRGRPLVMPGAPEAEPTGGAQRLGKITSNVSVPTHAEDS